MNLFNKLFFPRDGRKDHFKALDGLRGVAVLLVLLSHGSNVGMHLFGVLDFKQIGVPGVFLFFILSAYLLDRQIAVHFKNGTATARYWLHYASRRFIRIYPLFFAALLFNLFLHDYNPLYAIPVTDWDNIAQHLLLIKEKGLGIFWSIQAEFRYYLISPFIMLFINRFIKWNSLNVSLFLMCLVVFGAFLAPQLDLPKQSTAKYLPVFLIGTIISLLEIFSNTFKQDNSKDRKMLSWIGVLALIIFILTIRSVYQKVFAIEHYRLIKQYYYVLYAILWGIILIVCRNSDGFFTKAMSFKPLRFIGVISYSVYLFHWPVMLFVLKSGYFAQSMQVYAFVGLSIVLATLTYLFIEKPSSKIKLVKYPKS